MRQKYMVMVLLALIGAASLTSFHSYRATEQIVTSDMNQALALALAEQNTDVINSDTIQVFNSYLQLEQLRGQAVLAVDTRQRGFHCYAQCSTATIFSMSEQRPALALWTLAMLWITFCFFYRQRKIPLLTGLQQYGGLNYSAREGRFFDAQGEYVRLTPMQQQLMEMFFRSDTHLLTKTEICSTLWPKKEDASETLYTLIRRLKPIIEQHSDLRIESDRGRARLGIVVLQFIIVGQRRTISIKQSVRPFIAAHLEAAVGRGIDLFLIAVPPFTIHYKRHALIDPLPDRAARNPRGTLDDFPLAVVVLEGNTHRVTILCKDDRTVSPLVEVGYLCGRRIVGRVDVERLRQVIVEFAEIGPDHRIADGAHGVEFTLHVVTQFHADGCQRVLVAETPDEHRGMILVTADGGLRPLL